MLTDSGYFRNYLFTALESGPKLIRSAIGSLPAARLDYKTEPHRFTPREAIAHLADWDPVFLMRMRRTISEDVPTILGLDPDDLAREHRYEATDVQESLSNLENARAETIAFLKSLTKDQFSRECDRPEIGRVNVADMALLIPLHDMYHLEHLEEIRKSAS